MKYAVFAKRLSWHYNGLTITTLNCREESKLIYTYEIAFDIWMWIYLTSKTKKTKIKKIYSLDELSSGYNDKDYVIYNKSLPVKRDLHHHERLSDFVTDRFKSNFIGHIKTFKLVLKRSHIIILFPYLVEGKLFFF